MIFVNILLLCFLQWAFIITLPENQKTNFDEKKVKLQIIRQSPAAIDHEVYDEILKCQRANMILRCCHKMSNG